MAADTRTRRHRTISERGLGVLVGAWLLGGCGGGAPHVAPAGWCPEPSRPQDGDSAAGVVTVALVDTVLAARAPRPTNDSEALVFRHLYEGLTDLECGGEAVAALAASWSTPDDGRTWTFVLRDDARFANGAPVSGGDVLEAWRRARHSARTDPVRFALWRDLKLRDLTAADAHLEIRLATADPDLPRRLAAPEFAVSRAAYPGWPIGTKGRVLAETRAAGRTVWTVSTATADGEDVRFAAFPGVDPRDAFLPDVDLLVTRRRVALVQFEAMPGVRLTPLPWSRVYVVSATSAWPVGSLDAVRNELAEAVVPSAARVAGSAMLDPVDAVAVAVDAAADSVASPPPGAGPLPTPRTLLAPAGDPDALALAERMASRWARAGDPVIVSARPPDAVAAEMNAGGAGVFPLVRAVPGSSHQRRRLEALAPPGATLPDPLVCTRATVVSRAGLVDIAWGYDGVPRLDHVRRRTGALP